jgi:methyl-accepting chemotaxis protein
MKNWFRFFAGLGLATRTTLAAVSFVVLVAGAMLATAHMIATDRASQAMRTEIDRNIGTLAALFAQADRSVTLSVQDGSLRAVRSPAMPAFADHALVDATAGAAGGVATIFVTDPASGAFVRRTTNVKKEDGSRAIGTNLAPDHPAQAALRRGEPYFGPATLFGRQFYTAYMPVTDPAGKVAGVLFVGQPSAHYSEKGAADLKTMALAGFGITLVLVGLLLWVMRRTLRPIGAVTAAVTRIADGDVATAVTGADRGDEIGRMARAVEILRQSALERQQLEADARGEARNAELRAAGMETAIAGFQGAVQAVLADVDQTTRRLDATATTLGTVSARAKAQAGTAAGASQETASTIQTVAAAAEELSSSVGEIARQVAGATQVVRAATSKTDHSVTEIENLAQAAQRIGDVVGLIQGIAAQTNLLALNATIEAARAGESGRGFAVVASEVKTLAGQTSKATEEIASQIAGIQASTRSAVEAIREITAGMREIDEVTGAIAQAVEQQGIATREISQNVQVAARGTGALANSVGAVAGSIDETGASSATVQAASVELAAGASRLSEEIRTFVVALRSGPLDRRSGDNPDYRGPERRAGGARRAA